jgi:DNA-binding response OmpR family regulator
MSYSKLGKLKDLRVLVVEDHAPLRAALANLLEQHQAQVDFAANADQALELALAHAPEVIVLDIGLPGRDGYWLCERLRALADRHLPILMLTARDSLPDKLQGFGAGADDYLTKPFANDELLARIHALSLRARTGLSHLIEIGSLQLDLRLGEARRFGLRLDLHRRAWQILLNLAQAYPRAVSRSELVAQLWPDEVPPSDPLRSHLYLLRLALEQASVSAGKLDQPKLLHTIQHVGFKLVSDLT